MPTLPWNTLGTAAPEQDVVVLASRLELSSFRRFPGFLRGVVQIRKQLKHTPGVFGYSLIAHPLRKKFFTLSAWADEASLETFVGTPPHADVMARIRPAMRDSGFASWTMPASSLPVAWDDAHRRLEGGAAS